MLSVDQEGGRVERLVEPATTWPPMRTLGHIDDVNLTYRVGVALAHELRALNFDLDYAPVLDVDSNPKNPVIGDRSFSNHPGTVAKHGTALIKGFKTTASRRAESISRVTAIPTPTATSRSRKLSMSCVA